jgi:hypothetical protein
MYSSAMLPNERELTCEASSVTGLTLLIDFVLDETRDISQRILPA